MCGILLDANYPIIDATKVRMSEKGWGSEVDRATEERGMERNRGQFRI